jgi:hypothetical protein
MAKIEFENANDPEIKKQAREKAPQYNPATSISQKNALSGGVQWKQKR